MPILTADRHHLPAIHHLIEHAHTRLVQFGREDLPDLLARSICVVGVSEAPSAQPQFSHALGDVWGFVAIQLEPRPQTLPAHAPNRAYLRGILLAKGRSPSADTADLLGGALDRLGAGQADGVITQVILQGQGSWLRPP